jgi:hypothetical protein
MDFLKGLASIFYPKKRNLRLEKCECRKNNIEFCIEIENLLSLTKSNSNFNSDRAKKIYEVLKF